MLQPPPCSERGIPECTGITGPQICSQRAPPHHYAGRLLAFWHSGWTWWSCAMRSAGDSQTNSIEQWQRSRSFAYRDRDLRDHQMGTPKVRQERCSSLAQLAMRWPAGQACVGQLAMRLPAGQVWLGLLWIRSPVDQVCAGQPGKQSPAGLVCSGPTASRAAPNSARPSLLRSVRQARARDVAQPDWDQASSRLQT